MRAVLRSRKSCRPEEPRADFLRDGSLDNRAALLEAYRSAVKAIDESRADHAGGGMAGRQLSSGRKADPSRSARTCRPATTASCPSWPADPSRAIRGCSAWPGPSSPTPTAVSIPRSLRRFVRAYQEVQPLTIGELWAVAITLRIVLVENLGRLAERITDSRAARQTRTALADRLLGAGGRAAGAGRSRSSRRTNASRSRTAFAVQLVHRLRDQDPRVTPALTWLDERLASQGTTADAVGARRAPAAGRRERHGAQHHHQHAPDLRRRLDGVVRARQPGRRRARGRQRLREHGFPDAQLSTAAPSRSWRAARASPNSRSRSAATAAAASAPQPTRRRAGAVAAAIPATTDRRRAARVRAAIGYRPPLRKLAGAPLTASLGVGGYVACDRPGRGGPARGRRCSRSSPTGVRPLGCSACSASLGVIPAIDVAVAFVNRAVNAGFARDAAAGAGTARRRSRRTAHAGRGADAADLAATAIEEQIERLEIHHLASPEGDLHFALLSDWIDAASEHADGDEALLRRGRGRHRAAEPALRPGAGRRALPAAAPAPGLERRRSAAGSGGSASAASCMNSTGCCAARPTRRSWTSGSAPAVPTGVRYVITLDADTRLPRDAVRRLIGKMAHPLNRPRFDADGRRVVEGYAVLQPRVTPSLPMGREGSLFQRIFSSVERHRSLRAAVSDVYQDLFGEGSYTGKGIYDVDAFEAALAGRVPEFDAPQPRPVRRHVRARRPGLRRGGRRGISRALRRRRRSPSPLGARRLAVAAVDFRARAGAAGTAASSSAVPAIGRWKMLDNLRRTLSAPAAVLALLVGWTLPLPVALVWTLFVVLTIALPTLMPVDRRASRRGGPGVTMRSHMRALGGMRSLPLTLSTLIVVVPGPSGVADGRCDRSHALAPRSSRAGTCSNGFRRRSATIGPRLDVMGFARRMTARWSSARSRRSSRWRPATGVAVGASVRRAVARFAGRRALVSLLAAAASRLPIDRGRRARLCG